MAADQALRLLIRNTKQLHNLMVDFCSCIVTAIKHCTTIQILILLSGKTHQTKLLGHTILGDHSTGNLGGLLNIIGSTSCHAVKNDLFSSTSAKISDQHSFQFFLGIQIFLFFRNLHNVTKCAHSTRYNGDLLYRLGILLKGTYQCMSYLMIGYDTALLGT